MNMARTGFALLVASALALSSATTASAQVAEDIRAGTGMTYFADEFDTVIWTPHLSVGATVGGETEVDVAWESDVITSASIDVITAATPEMTEVRNEVSVIGSRERVIGELDLNGSYVFSHERDSESHTAQIGAAHGFMQDNYVASVSYALSYNLLGINKEPRSLWRPLTVHTTDLTLTRILDPRTLVEFNATTFFQSGYQAGPYREVPILHRDDAVVAEWRRENVPDFRLRQALTTRVRRAVGASWTFAGDYRFYFDTWGVMSHTLVLEQALNITNSIGVRTRERATLQGAADFYEELYTFNPMDIDDTGPDYVTRDRRLGAHESGIAGATLFWEVGRWDPLGAIDLHLGADVIAWHYPEYDWVVLDINLAADPEPVGWIFGTIVNFGVEIKQ